MLSSFPAFASGVNVLKLVEKSIVSVSSETAEGKVLNGSGVITRQDEILTNCHVLKNAFKVNIKFSNGDNARATIKGRVGKLDVCALSALTRGRPNAIIEQIKNIQAGEPVYAIGNPLNLNQSISDGIVASIRDIEMSKVIQITAPISNGSSGGGLFNSHGKLLGLTSFYLASGQNLNFAIPAEYRTTMGLEDYDPNELESKSSEKKESKSISLSCSGKKKTERNFKFLGEEQASEEQASLALDINFQESWVIFKDDWGCVLDLDRPLFFETEPFCSSKISFNTMPKGMENKILFYKDGKDFVYKKSETAYSTSFTLNRATGLLTTQGTILYSNGDDIVYTYEMSCLPETRKF